MQPGLRLIIFLALVGALWPHDADAGPSRAHREAARRGWVLGLTFGSASSDVSVENNGASLSSGWIGGGRVIRGRLGYYLRENLLLTGEYGVWRRADAASDSLAADEAASSSAGWTAATDRYLGAVVVGAQLYPLDAGFSLKAGAGYGRVSATVARDGLTLSQDQYGFVLVMGTGYEFSIAHDISIGLGADVGRFDGGSTVGMNFLHLTATVQLHLPEGIPRSWF